MDVIRVFYADKRGKYPECFGDVRLMEESAAGAADRSAPRGADPIRWISLCSREPGAMRSLDAWGWIFAIFGAVCVANALWMLAGPLHWYRELPAAVPDTGPFNPHFVRDIGWASSPSGRH